MIIRPPGDHSASLGHLLPTKPPPPRHRWSPPTSKPASKPAFMVASTSHGLPSTFLGLLRLPSKPPRSLLGLLQPPRSPEQAPSAPTVTQASSTGLHGRLHIPRPPEHPPRPPLASEQASTEFARPPSASMVARASSFGPHGHASKLHRPSWSPPLPSASLGLPSEQATGVQAGLHNRPSSPAPSALQSKTLPAKSPSMNAPGLPRLSSWPRSPDLQAREEPPRPLLAPCGAPGLPRAKLSGPTETSPLSGLIETSFLGPIKA